MSSTKEVVILSRDCIAYMVPSGARMMLHQGTEVTITQDLGDTYTVNVYGNLVRIDNKDADALGKKAKSILSELPDDASLEDKVWAQMKTCFDPEIPVNIVDLGLIYSCEISEHPDGGFLIQIKMTLTAPGCGMGPVIAGDVKAKILAIPSVTEADVEVVFDPPWDREMMSDTAKLELGMF